MTTHPLYVRPQQAIIGGLLCRDSDKAETLYAKALWAKTDTGGLASTAQGHRNYMFLTERGQKHTDATFCAAIQIMAGAPLTKAKRARFTQLPNGNKCESCGDRVKNLQHILQVCPRVRGARIKRHDQVQALLEGSLKAKNRKFHKDNIIPMGGTVRKPDLVIIDENKISVVDPTIVSDSLSLHEAENNKAATYNTEEFKRALLKYFECEESHKIDQVEVVPILEPPKRTTQGIKKYLTTKVRKPVSHEAPKLRTRELRQAVALRTPRNKANHLPRPPLDSDVPPPTPQQDRAHRTIPIHNTPTSQPQEAVTDLRRPRRHIHQINRPDIPYPLKPTTNGRTWINKIQDSPTFGHLKFRRSSYLVSQGSTLYCVSSPVHHCTEKKTMEEPIFNFNNTICPVCGLKGSGVSAIKTHATLKHPAEWNKAKKFNYDTEFLVTKNMTRELAKAELKLTKEIGHKVDFQKNINSYLQQRFPKIPGKILYNVRRKITYKQLLKNLSEEQTIEESEAEEHLSEDFPCLEIAEVEVSLIINNPTISVAAISEVLLDQFPSLNDDSLEGVRLSPDYKDIVEDMLEKFRADAPRTPDMNKLSPAAEAASTAASLIDAASSLIRTSVFNSPVGARSPDAPSIRRLSIASEALKEAKEALTTPNKRVEIPRLSPTSPTLLDYDTPLEVLHEEPGMNQTIQTTTIEETQAYQTVKATDKPQTIIKFLTKKISGHASRSCPKELKVTLNPSDRLAADAVLGKRILTRKKRERPINTFPNTEESDSSDSAAKPKPVKRRLLDSSSSDGTPPRPLIERETQSETQDGGTADGAPNAGRLLTPAIPPQECVNAVEETAHLEPQRQQRHGSPGESSRETLDKQTEAPTNVIPTITHPIATKTAKEPKTTSHQDPNIPRESPKETPKTKGPGEPIGTPGETRGNGGNSKSNIPPREETPKNPTALAQREGEKGGEAVATVQARTKEMALTLVNRIKDSIDSLRAQRPQQPRENPDERRSYAQALELSPPQIDVCQQRRKVAECAGNTKIEGIVEWLRSHLPIVTQKASNKEGEDTQDNHKTAAAEAHRKALVSHSLKHEKLLLRDNRRISSERKIDVLNFMLENEEKGAGMSARAFYTWLNHSLFAKNKNAPPASELNESSRTLLNKHYSYKLEETAKARLLKRINEEEVEFNDLIKLIIDDSVSGYSERNNGTKKPYKASNKRIQQALGSDFPGTIGLILDGKASQVGKNQNVPRQVINDWVQKFETASVKDARTPNLVNKVDHSMEAPISAEEISEAMPSMAASRDPMGIRGAEIRDLPMEELVQYFNRALFDGKLPQELTTGRTTLIPKNEDPQLAGDFRPITVLPHITRVLHKVLANRIKKARISSCQKGFREMNGCSENNLALRNLIGTAIGGQRSFPLAFAFIDLAKAFDSVSHESMLLAARRVGIPPLIINYIRNLYQNARTRIGDQDAIVKSGVLQGDPLSGHLFNFVLDWVLDVTYNTTPIGDRNPVRIGATHVEALLFADDAVLVSRDIKGLQKLVNAFLAQCEKAGLRANPQKCAFTAIRTAGKAHFVDASEELSVMGEKLTPMNVSDAYKYLGVVFTPKGMAPVPLLEGIQDGLGRLNGIGLTVFQRYIALRDHLIPRLIYSLTYGKVSQAQVRQADQVVRLAVKDWMKLARDTPREFYYAPTSAGGLALMELEVRRKLFQNKRIASLRDSKDPIIRAIITQDPL
ncbi:Uncharacterized protein FKW44_014743 [Caligus rogercresseyi]|uniref:Reverse transcriptase domain-containing protein n=1 Tax=Caligus rogercresseyi TaxID=217165 RepID=A0A7T8JZ63_CALRO|nr:Uncharacterized protein FKW44_014743 [Caligus rogercresseyi]